MAERRFSRREVLRITASVGVGAALTGGLTSGILRAARLHRVRETRSKMGTLVTIAVIHPDAPAASSMVEEAFAEIERLENIFSRHRVGTPVSRLNVEGRLVGPPTELFEVLRYSDQIARVSGGAFDPTVVPLLSLYQRSFRDRGEPPGALEVERARRLVDYRGLQVDEDVVRFDRPDMAITLDGIAKGYIVDRTVAVLADAGSERVLVDAGGDMATAGTRSASDPWTIAIQDPHDDAAVAGLVRLAGECIATSGDYMQAFSKDRRFHHIIDPRSGVSPIEASGVSVVASSAMEADALSTASLVLGSDDGIALLERRRGVEGLIVTKDGRRVQSSGFVGRGD
jgi:thiamine biosynthesis lipoprotein